MREPEDLPVGIEQRGEAVVLSPSGDVDLSRSPALRESIRKAFLAKPRRLVVNLEAVEYMDSSGVATLVEAMQLARRADARMVLCGLTGPVRSILEIARLDTVFRIVATTDEAMRV